MAMHFVYEGFTQRGNTRCFSFRGIQEQHPAILFSIQLDLSLLLQSHVPVQEGPMFCLQLLTAASFGGTAYLDKFHNYRVVAEDFRPLLVERERKTAEKALKKPFRKPFQKPPLSSNVNIGSHWRNR